MEYSNKNNDMEICFVTNENTDMNIECENKLILEATASLTGNIKTKQLVIECGAMFQGKCEMNSNGEQAI